MVLRLSIIALFFSLSSFAGVRIIGKTLHYTKQTKLEVSQVNVINLEDNTRFSVVISNGKYRINIKENGLYKVEYTKKGYYNKYLKIDCRGIPGRKMIPMYIDMDMVEKIDGFDASIFDEPMGIAHYNVDLENMEWDVNHSRAMFDKVNAEFQRIYGKKESEDGKDKSNSTGSASDSEDEIYIPTPEPMINHALRYGSRLDHSVYISSSTGVGMTRYLRLGAVTAQLGLNIHDLKKVKEIIPLHESLMNALSVDFTYDWFIDSLAAADSSEKEQVYADLYFKMRDEIEATDVYYDLGYIDIGGYIEILHRSVGAYSDNKSEPLNNLIGDSGHYLNDMAYYIEEVGSDKDRESAFPRDLRELSEIADKIKDTSEEAEQLTGDMRYEITGENLSELSEKLAQLRRHVVGQ